MSYTIGSLSSGIFENEFDSDPDTVTNGRISGWLESNVGQLNAAIYTEFDEDLTTVSTDYEFGHEEAAIYSQMYMRAFYSKAARSTLLGTSVTASGSSVTSITGMSEWTKVQEGDTVIERQPLYTTSSSSGSLDITKLSQRYKDLMDSTADHLSEMIAAYNNYGSKPRQISGLDGG